MGVRHADFGVTATAGFTGELEGEDTGGIGLHGEDLEIEHQLHVVRVGGRDAYGAVSVRHRAVGGFGLGFLDAAFDFPYRFEVMSDPGFI